jgi:hypothetical protein
MHPSLHTSGTVVVSLLGLLLCLGTAFVSPGQSPSRRRIVVDDFEADRAGAYPRRWQYVSKSQKTVVPLDRLMNDQERFYVVAEGDNKYLRAYTRAQAQRITLLNGQGGYRWDLRTHPRLAWKWRALQLPEGASERNVNDTGAALYATFEADWLGRPKSIKYTYSSTLPVGTVVGFGRLKVIVVASARDGIGRWIAIERDVAADYRDVFGDDPPHRPVSITLWSDSDNTRDVAEVDFDDIVLLDR